MLKIIHSMYIDTYRTTFKLFYKDNCIIIYFIKMYVIVIEQKYNKPKSICKLTLFVCKQVEVTIFPTTEKLFSEITYIAVMAKYCFACVLRAVYFYHSYEFRI